MRILAVTPYYEPEGGGLERYAHAVLSRLADHGHTVHALTFTRERATTEIRNGVHVTRVSPLFTLGNAPIHPTFPRRVARAIRELDPEVVVAHTPVPFPAEMAYLAAARAGVPFVTTYHAGNLQASSDLLAPLAWLDRHTLQARMLSGSARLIAVSPYVRDNALVGHEAKTTVIAPGVDHERFSPGDGAHPGRGARRPEILFVGPLDTSYRWKGLDVLWDAYRRVHQHVPEASLTLIGDGDRYEELTERASVLQGEVALPGRVPEAELIAAYRRAAVTVLPSTSDAESFGMVLAEAGACGCPVVASDIGGIPSIVDDGENGLLARPGDIVDLAEKITRVLTEPTLAQAMGQRGRQRVLEAHDWDDIAMATERVLADAVSSG